MDHDGTFDSSLGFGRKTLRSIEFALFLLRLILWVGAGVVLKFFDNFGIKSIKLEEVFAQDLPEMPPRNTNPTKHNPLPIFLTVFPNVRCGFLFIVYHIRNVNFDFLQLSQI